MTQLRVAILNGNWDVPSASPACLKLLTWLRMADIDHEVEVLSGPPKSKTKKAPYILRADGSILDDSSVIIDTLTAEHQIELDADRSPRERALMTLVKRTVENHLYFAGLLHRWRDNWEQTRDSYFHSIPRPVRLVMGPVVRRKVLAQARAQGLGLRPTEHMHAEALTDIGAIEELLGNEPFFFGSPGVTDAIVYGALENTRSVPLPGPVQDRVLGSSRLTAYLDRIKSQYWEC